MEERVYHVKGVEDSGFYPRFDYLFSEILEKDYHGKEFGFSDRVLATRCIDMDAVEKDGGGVFDRTMDCVVGVSDYDEAHSKHSRHRLMMVEMKLGCTGFSMKPGYLRDKVNHTLELLSGKLVDSARCFIFPKRVIGDAKRRLSQWKRGSDGELYRDWVFLQPAEYNDFLHFAEDYPYTPVTDRQDIENTFKDDGFFSADIQKIVKVREYWLSLALEYKYRGVVDEYDHIVEIVDEIVSSLVNEMEDGDDKELLKLEFQI